MIYLDYAATTPLDTEVFAAMRPFLDNQCFGNPNSIQHTYGKTAALAVENARAQFAQTIHAKPEEIIWTSGATESINLALQGIARAYQSRGKHIISVATEHKATLDTLAYLAKQGFEITLLPVNQQGLIDLGQLGDALRKDTILVSIMQVNNETGAIQDIETIASIVKNYDALLHVDAAQSFGKVAIDLTQTAIDLMSFSGHKIYGPKGIGALFVRQQPRIKIQPLCYGGGQEQRLRPGTLAPHQIVGFAKAAWLAIKHQNQRLQKIMALNQFARQHLNKIEKLIFNSDIKHAVPHILNISLPDLEGEALLMAVCEEIAVASGSACQSASISPSHVLLAMGLSPQTAYAAMRLSFSHLTTKDEAERAINYISQKIRQLRQLWPAN